MKVKAAPFLDKRILGRKRGDERRPPRAQDVGGRR